MTLGTWVCFDCRLAQRHPTWRHIGVVRPYLIGGTSIGTVKCSECHKLCNFLGPEIELPPKRDFKAWETLRQEVMLARQEALDDRHKRSIRLKHDLEQRIQELKDRGPDKERERLIKFLESQIARA